MGDINVVDDLLREKDVRANTTRARLLREVDGVRRVGTTRNTSTQISALEAPEGERSIICTIDWDVRIGSNHRVASYHTEALAILVSFTFDEIL